jgi:hypothetical protein
MVDANSSYNLVTPWLGSTLRLNSPRETVWKDIEMKDIE